MEQHSRSACPISFSLDIIGDKWSLLIIRDIMFFGKQTYSEFLESPEGIASNTARDRLLKLTKSGLIFRADKKTRYWNRPYLLTEKAIDLAPMIFDLVEWGTKYGSPENVQAAVYKMPKNRKKAIADIQADLRKKNAKHYNSLNEGASHQTSS